MPGPSSSTTSDAPLPIAPDRDADPAVGRAVADGVVDQDHDQLAEPGRVAGHDRRLRIDLDPDAAVGRGLAHRRGAVGGHVAEVDRDVLERDGARIGAGEQQQVLDDRGHVADLVVDVLERRADRRDRLVAMPLEVLDAAPDDGQRRAQLVAGVGGELALAAQRDALVGQRLADRDERPARIDRPEPERDQRRRPARRRAGRPASRRASAARRPVAGRPGRRTSAPSDACTVSVRMRTGVWMDGRRSAGSELLGRQRRRPDIATVARAAATAAMSGRPSGTRNPRWVSTVVVLVDDQRDGPAAAAAEEEAVRRRVIGRARPLPGQVALTWSNRLSSWASPLLASEPATAT